MVNRTIASQPAGLVNSCIFTVGERSNGITGNNFLPLFGDLGSNPEADVQQVMTSSGVLKNLYIYTDTLADQARTVTLRLNGANTALTATVAIGQQAANDTTHQVAVVAGDLVCWSAIATGNAYSVYVGCEFVGGSVNFGIFLYCTDLALDSAFDVSPVVTQHWWLNNAFETWVQQIVPRNVTMKNLRVVLATAPGVGQSRTFTLRVNGANTALTCTISGLNTVGTDAVNSVAVTAGQRICYGITASAAPAASKFRSSVEWYT